MVGVCALLGVSDICTQDNVLSVTPKILSAMAARLFKSKDWLEAWRICLTTVGKRCSQLSEKHYEVRSTTLYGVIIETVTCHVTRTRAAIVTTFFSTWTRKCSEYHTRLSWDGIWNMGFKQQVLISGVRRICWNESNDRSLKL